MLQPSWPDSVFESTPSPQEVSTRRCAQHFPFEVGFNVWTFIVYPSDLASVLTGARNPGEESFEDDKFIPARRFGGEEEMAGSILYLAGRPGSYSNGSVLLTDGGRLSVMTGTY